MVAGKKLSGKDLLLLLLYAPGVSGKVCEAIRGRTRLTKMVFLFETEIYESFKFDKVMEAEKLPEFKAWRYGPFSRDVYSDMDFFAHIGFVEMRECGDGETLEAEAEEFRRWESEVDIADDVVSEYSEEVIRLTGLGQGYVEDRKLWDNLSDNQRDALGTFKSRMAAAPLYAILKYVYEKYPKYTELSDIRDRVLRSA